jgi:hypothetical protein
MAEQLQTGGVNVPAWIKPSSETCANEIGNDMAIFGERQQRGLPVVAAMRKAR